MAATKIFLHDALSKLGTIATGGASYGCASGTNNTVYRLADISQGSSTATKTFAPTAVNPPCIAQTNSCGGDYLIWVTPPISANVTISSNINYSAGCQESHNPFNGGFRFLVKRWSPTGGIVSTVHTSADTSECATSAALRTISAAAPTSTNFVVGDRIVFVIEIVNVGSWGANDSRTIDILFDGTSGGSGDAFANFVDNISFSADSANGLVNVQ